MTDPLDLAISKVGRIVHAIHECAPDHSVHNVRVGDLRFLAKVLEAARVKYPKPLGDAVAELSQWPRSMVREFRAASGMSASGQDPEGLEAKPASPTAESGDAPQGPPISRQP